MRGGALLFLGELIIVARAIDYAPNDNEMQTPSEWSSESGTQRIAAMGPRSKQERKRRRNSLTDGRTNAIAGPRNDQLLRQRDSNSS